MFGTQKKGSPETVTVSQGKTILARLTPGMDLIAGIEDICHKNGIKSAAIISGIGSLHYTHYVYATKDDTITEGVGFTKPIRVDGPLELLSCQGFVGINAEDNLNVHLHGIMTGPGNRTYGGHILPAGSPVLVTVELVIQEKLDVKIVQQYDPISNFPLFKFYFEE